jgi:hypothetical protein
MHVPMVLHMSDWLELKLTFFFFCRNFQIEPLAIVILETDEYLL